MKACHDFNNDFTLFYSNSSFINMYTDKDSNLLIELFILQYVLFTGECLKYTSVLNIMLNTTMLST